MSQPPPDRLKELRAQAAELEARRVLKAQQLAASRAEQTAELDVALAVALEQAEEKHGPLGVKLLVVDARYADGHRFGAVIIRAPDPAVWGRFQAKFPAAKGTEIDAERERLWSPCVVWPALPEVERFVRETPWLSVAMGDAVGRLAGVRQEETEGK